MKSQSGNPSPLLLLCFTLILVLLLTNCIASPDQIDAKVVTKTPEVTTTSTITPLITLQPTITQSNTPIIISAIPPSPTTTMTVLPNIPPPGGMGYGFENGVEGWVINEAGKNKVAELAISNTAYAGTHSLEVLSELHGNDDDIYRHTEAMAYFNNPPEGLMTPGPYNWTGKTISCYVFFPKSLAAETNPAYARIIVKDSNYANIFSEAVDINHSTIEQWLKLTVVVQSVPGLDFNPQLTEAIGIRIDTHDGFPLTFKDSFLIDECRIQ